jgi:hypothetical protein
MPRNGSGVMSIPNTLVTQTTIEVGPHNANYSDIAAEISNSLALDGQSQLSGPLKAASGTVGAPGITFGSDTDSGLYRIAGDNIGFTIGGTKLLDMASGAFSITGTLAVSGAITENGAAVYKANGTDVAIADGGTGASTTTAGFDALAPTTTRGDLIVRGASNNGRLAIGAADTVLKSDGTDAAYGKIIAANITDSTITRAKLASDCFPARAYAEYTTNASLTTTIPQDDTLPQNTEGTEILTASITLKNASSRVRARFSGPAWTGNDDINAVAAALFINTDADALAVSYWHESGDSAGDHEWPLVIDFEHAPGSVGPHTYKVRAGPTSGSMRFNGDGSGRLYGGALRTVLILEEVFA